ncbi:hypothetical protein CVT25_014572, partial [Psilocybe cyanescens]
MSNKLTVCVLLLYVPHHLHFPYSYAGQFIKSVTSSALLWTHITFILEPTLAAAESTRCSSWTSLTTMNTREMEMNRSSCLAQCSYTLSLTLATTGSHNNSADIEQKEPDKEKLTTEEYQEAVKRLEQRRKNVASRKAQINRWFEYRYKKEKNRSKPGARVPYTALIQGLTGKEPRKPRLRSSINLWRKTARAAIKDELQAMDPPVEQCNVAKTREAIVRRMFSMLHLTEQMRWKQATLDEHKAAIAAFEAGVSAMLRPRVVDAVHQIL